MGLVISVKIILHKPEGSRKPTLALLVPQYFFLKLESEVEN